jgi:hypothetical protein
MKKTDFVEVKTTDNQTLFVLPQAIGAFEVVLPSQRVEGHLKVYIGGFKFLVKEEPEEFLKKLSSDT